ncbi:CVNH domain-containing protein [Polyangium jinanense]|uniref:CVNH domain-containing protein n=1 Tax=Polyangium jinanense TaxID=2829994 RepID=A0A9X4AXK3_9BACT|nr:CVNH domain-containing protein [Polyangium jinanense]MDC3962887.1 CVNH domain-containing protein [Polyangium jinanense]MDC3988643.1 CVNH domain-containing protein [Polyangium jinanense]
MSRKFAISFAAVALTGLFAAGVADARGAFEDSCDSIRIFNHTNLSANCKMRNGNVHFGAHIDLNQYLANDDGRLVWRRGGNFGATCSNITVIHPQIGRMGATCRQRNGMTVFAFIQLGEHIANIDGNLTIVEFGPQHDEL